MWNTVPHYKVSVDTKNVKYPFHTGQDSILFEVTEGLNYKDNEICNTPHKPEYYTIWQKK